MNQYDRLIAAIYSGVEHPEDWRDALELLARATGSRAAGLFVVRDGQLGYDLDAGMPEEFMAGFRARAASDPRLGIAARRPRLSVVSDDAPSMRPAIEQAGLDRFKRQFDLHFTSAAIMPGRPGVLPVLYVSRAQRQGPLGARGADWIHRAAPHMGRALHLHGLLARAQRVEPALASDDGIVATVPRGGNVARLPARLRMVLALVDAGLSNAEIAARLHVSVNTVRTHLRRLFEASGCHRRTALVREARRRGWLR